MLIIKNNFYNILQTFHQQNLKNETVKYNHKIKTTTERYFTMNKNDQLFMAQKIRTQYTEKEATELDALRELDSKVKRPANVFGYTFGSIAAIVMGAGMSLVMTDIGATVGISEPMLPGIVIGVVGMLMAIVNYPICKKILASRKKKYADKIIAISEKILGNN